MGLAININFAGQKEIDRTLGIRMELVRDLRPAWNHIEKALYSFQRKVFQSEGAADGLTKWADRKTPNKRPILVKTGKMRDAFTKPGSEGSAETTKEPLFFSWGIDELEVPYAKYHQTGTRHMVARKPLRLTNNIRKRIVKLIQAHLVQSGQFQQETLL